MRKKGEEKGGRSKKKRGRGEVQWGGRRMDEESWGEQGEKERVGSPHRHKCNQCEGDKEREIICTLYTHHSS